ncbi:MAG: hypothetical protein KKD35_01415 [Elusimicrobia bacterium]|nr:hypothetical protein [Elusimicrobiota bacterium]
MTKNNLLNGFYYLAPLWFIVEIFFWPGFRAGLIFGNSFMGSLAFYSIEAGLGAAIYFKLPYGNLSAFIENVLYLLFAMKFILFMPLDIALAIDEDTTAAVNMAQHYKAALPGMIYSGFHIILRMKTSMFDIKKLISKS